MKSANKRPVYLDCNATAPIEPEVRDAMLPYLDLEFGNSGSRTHEYGQRAKRAVEEARNWIAKVVDCEPEEVYFTSGATESNNLAILGLAAYGSSTGRKHIITTAIEHKAVLEPLVHLEKLGFEITLIPVRQSGRVEVDAIRAAIRPTTLLVSVMHVNNETGIIQPIQQIASDLVNSDVFFHVDAAQGFGKELDDLRNVRIDLISVSGHKIYGPKGIGALIARKRDFERPPLTPLMFGGGQERGLRPGTVPVHLAVGLGTASKLAVRDNKSRRLRNLEFQKKLVSALEGIGAVFNGDQRFVIPSTVNISLAGIDAEAAMVAVKDMVSVSNGSACTSTSYTPSHVLSAMLADEERINGAIRFSWSHMTSDVDWKMIVRGFQSIC